MRCTEIYWKYFKNVINYKAHDVSTWSGVKDVSTTSLEVAWQQVERSTLEYTDGEVHLNMSILTFKRDKFSFKDLVLIIFFIIVPVEIES